MLQMIRGECEDMDEDGNMGKDDDMNEDKMDL